ncbi:MAG: rod shape-determining protein RodA [Acidimicrobiia bacterium]|nr:rod shape-determining protein RodA [Acidimicrobiia bacterium]
MSLTTGRTEPVTILQRERSLRPDLFLILPYLALAALGIVMVYTASAPRNELLDLDPAITVRRHVIFVLIGFAVFIASSLIGGRTLRSLSIPFYTASVIALGLVLTPLGRELKGAQRWIQIGPLQVQPSEFAKIAVILALAVLLANAGSTLKWQHIGKAVVMVGIPAVLIFLQPDLGTMLVFFFVSTVMLFIGGTTFRQLAFIGLAAIVVAVALFQLGAIKQYQIDRVTSYLDGGSGDDADYNQLQSEIAIGSGGFFGKGLFGGTQTNLSFVPEQSSDFIFTAVGEQLGFVGGSIVLGLYAMIVWRLLIAAGNGRERFSQMVAIGVAALLVFHVFVNVGMTLRLIPVTGLPLPFLSAGGTFFIAMSLGLGLAHSVWMRRSPVPDE